MAAFFILHNSYSFVFRICSGFFHRRRRSFLPLPLSWKRRSVALCLLRSRHHHIALRHLRFQDFFGNRVFDVLLDRTVQRTGTVLRIVSFFGHEIFRLIGQLNLVTQGFDAVEQLAKRNVDDLVDVFFASELNTITSSRRFRNSGEKVFFRAF